MGLVKIHKRLSGSQRAHLEEARVEAARLRSRADAIERAALESVIAEHEPNSDVKLFRDSDGLPASVEFEPVAEPQPEHVHDEPKGEPNG